MILAVLMLALADAASCRYIEMCCTFSAALQKDITTITTMFDSVGYKLVMGCSIKQSAKCACFENTWGCEKITVSQLKPERLTFQIENGSPASIFDNVMREIHRPVRPQEKDKLHVYMCEGTVATPYVWTLVTSEAATWSNKKFCFSETNTYEMRFIKNMSMGVSVFNLAIKNIIKNYNNFNLDSVLQEIFLDEAMSVDITTTSELAFNKLSDRLRGLFKEVHANYIPYTQSDKFQLQREELLMEFGNFKCRAYDYRDCLKLLALYNQGAAVHTLYHLTSDLQDLFMTVTSTPAVLLVYTPTHYDETQELCVYLDSSLGQSSLSDYSVAMMSETAQYPAGVYYILYPNSIKKCADEVYRCLSNKFRIYLPPAPEIVNSVVPVVFGEQFINQENHHRGNLNKAWFFEPPPELKKIYDIQTLLQASDYEPELKSETTTLRVLDVEGYYSAIKDSRGHFILFVFRSDVSSLYTIKQLLETSLPGILIVECFNLNLICDQLDIKSYPVVYFARNNDTLHYAGPLEQTALNTFRELIEHPVVTRAHRIQVDLVLKGGENKAVVMISSGKKDLEDLFHLACDEVYGFIRCYLLDSNEPNEDMLIVHVPDDPVMINKKYMTNGDNSVESWVKVIKKLSLPSVISESELLLVYKDLSDIVLFDQVLSDELAVVVNTFPAVQFVQVSSPDFKHKLLSELIGYDYDDAMLFISKTRGCGYKFPEEATIETWLTGAVEGSLRPDFKLKDLEGSKYQYQDIYYKNQFRVFEQSVRSMRKHVDEMNRNLGRNANEWKSHQEL